jgi:hypothetical protein
LRKGKSNIYYEKCRLSRLKRQISSLSDRNLELTDEEESEAHHNKENEDEKTDITVNCSNGETINMFYKK